MPTPAGSPPDDPSKGPEIRLPSGDQQSGTSSPSGKWTVSSSTRLGPLHQTLDLPEPTLDDDERRGLGGRRRGLLHEEATSVARDVERQSHRVVELDVEHRLGGLRMELGRGRGGLAALDSIEVSIERHAATTRATGTARRTPRSRRPRSTGTRSSRRRARPRRGCRRRASRAAVSARPPLRHRGAGATDRGRTAS